MLKSLKKKSCKNTLDTAEKALKALESKDGKLAVDKIQEALVNLGFT